MVRAKRPIWEATKSTTAGNIWGNRSYRLRWRGRRFHVPESDGSWRLIYSGLQDESPSAQQAMQPTHTTPQTAPAPEMPLEMGAPPTSDSVPSTTATQHTPKASPFTNMPPWAPRRVFSGERARSPATTFTSSVTEAGDQPEERKGRRRKGGEEEKRARMKSNSSSPATGRTVAAAQIGPLVSLPISLRAIRRSSLEVPLRWRLLPQTPTSTRPFKRRLNLLVYRAQLGGAACHLRFLRVRPTRPSMARNRVRRLCALTKPTRQT